MQGPNWRLGEELGRGINGAVYTCDSLKLPGVVLKKGPEENKQAEAELQRLVNHPNVAKVYGISVSGELDEQGRHIAYLAIERLHACVARRR